MGKLEITDHNITEPSINYMQNYSIFFCGTIIDERGESVRSELNNTNVKIVEVGLIINESSMTIGDETMHMSKISKKLNEYIVDSSYSEIVLDSTTLGFVELLLLLKWFSSTTLEKIIVLYVEPEEYNSSNDIHDLGPHEFDLTESSFGFKSVLGFSKVISPNDKTVLVAVLGFEKSRLGNLIQEDDGAYIDSFLPLFATPSFKTGWDKFSFYQNIDLVEGKGKAPQFVSAQSPLDVYLRLCLIKEGITDENIMIAPFGTKPTSLGVAVFLLNNIGEVSLKYDHPVKKLGRSRGTANTHKFVITNLPPVSE